MEHTSQYHSKHCTFIAWPNEGGAFAIVVISPYAETSQRIYDRCRPEKAIKAYLFLDQMYAVTRQNTGVAYRENVFRGQPQPDMKV